MPKMPCKGIDNQVDTMTLDPSTLSTPPSFGQLLGSTNAFSHHVAPPSTTPTWAWALARLSPSPRPSTMTAS